jgi:hypothetical protein
LKYLLNLPVSPWRVQQPDRVWGCLRRGTIRRRIQRTGLRASLRTSGRKILRMKRRIMISGKTYPIIQIRPAWIQSLSTPRAALPLNTKWGTTNSPSVHRILNKVLSAMWKLSPVCLSERRLPPLTSKSPGDESSDSSEEARDGSHTLKNYQKKWKIQLQNEKQ